MKNKSIYIFLALLIVTAGYFLVAHLYPKSLGRYPFFILLGMLDYYVYASLKSFFPVRKRALRWFAVIVYWSPLLLTLLMALISLAMPFNLLPKPVAVLVPGIILVTYASKIVAADFLLLSDVARGILYLRQKRQKIGRSKYIVFPGYALAVILLLLMTWGMTTGVYRFKIHSTAIESPSVPLSFDGFRIVQLSDLHLGSWLSEKKMTEVVEMVNRLQPDMIVITGDLVNYRSDEALQFEEVFRKLSAGEGKYAILGNHDYGDYSHWKSKAEKEENMKVLYAFYERTGFRLLRNENARIIRNSDTLALVGIENWGSFSRFQKFGDYDRAVAGAGNVPFKILLSHDPTFWELNSPGFKMPVLLTLSGHTHGFQLGWEVGERKWSPSMYIYDSWCGLYKNRNQDSNEVQYLYVNRGLGSLGYPGRLGIWPEISVFELKHSGQKDRF